MYEDAQEIFDYLPIRRDTPENDYINHLWQTFIILDESVETARSFAVMPFHLLFMLAVQYRVLRIAKVHKQSLNLFFSGVGGRSKTQLLSEKRSVFDIALINERTIPEIFQLVDLDNKTIKKVKDLVDERNDNLAHAKGGIESDLDGKIDEYINVIDSIQKCSSNINQKLAESWFSEIQSEDDMGQFLETHLLDSCISPRDFGDIIRILLDADKLNWNHWEQVVKKGLELAYDQTILILRCLAINDLYNRFNALCVLQDNGEIDEDTREKIMKDEKDLQILELLKPYPRALGGGAQQYATSK